MEYATFSVRMVDSIYRLKKDFYPIAYDTSKKEVLFQAKENQFFIHETEAGRKYKVRIVSRMTAVIVPDAMVLSTI